MGTRREFIPSLVGVLYLGLNGLAAVPATALATRSEFNSSCLDYMIDTSLQNTQNNIIRRKSNTNVKSTAPQRYNTKEKIDEGIRATMKFVFDYFTEIAEKVNSASASNLLRYGLDIYLPHEIELDDDKNKRGRKVILLDQGEEKNYTDFEEITYIFPDGAMLLGSSTNHDDIRKIVNQYETLRVRLNSLLMINFYAFGAREAYLDRFEAISVRPFDPNWKAGDIEERFGKFRMEAVATPVITFYWGYKGKEGDKKEEKKTNGKIA